ncbi:MAG TPA: histidine kinase [Sporosarcina psychrophila]|uniref:Oxygen sensor histidine kinase NreB n=1 Tax=Sporosarcina psychrophila TaxID=1476 RepID=A0A921G0N6_SPOPS|nr:histidine kinase [Sporosarcina psychrophila]
MEIIKFLVTKLKGYKKKTPLIDSGQAHVDKDSIKVDDTYQDTMELIRSIHHLTDHYPSTKSPLMLIEEITAFVIKRTKSDEAFFWLTDVDHQNSYLASSTNNTRIESELKKEWHTLRGKRGLFVEMMNGEWYGMRVIRTTTNTGILGVKLSCSSEARKVFLLNHSFEFSAEFSELMLDRIHTDLMKSQMIIIEEQNRIANEIHDSVSQRLFGIVYALHSLQMKSRTMTSEELKEEHQFISQSANTTIKELRSVIYRLSSIKKEENPFLIRLKNYLDEYSRLNDIEIDYQLTGDEALISDHLKQALYRIICEACGNAVRHGQCTAIELKLSLLVDKIVLDIQDNGSGIHSYDYDAKNRNGIGLFNMQNIVSSFIGTFSIGSFHGSGTEIRIEIPNLKMLQKEEAVG